MNNSTAIDLKNHFCLQNSEQLKKINSPLNFLGLDAFCFTSVDIHTSERFILTDHPDWTHFAYNNTNLYSTETVKKIESNNLIELFLWEDFANNTDLSTSFQAANDHGLKHGISIMHYTKDRMNMYYAGTSRTLENDKILLDIKDQLVDFIPYFHFAAKELIAESAHHAFTVRKNQIAGDHLIDPTQLKLFYDAIAVKQLVISEQGDYLTHQEAICVYLSLCGQTAKQISEKLHITIRTVEKHLGNARKKLHIHPTESLLGKIFESQYFKHIMIYGKWCSNFIST